ncbi:hypothetical protein QFZ82_007662 [Streptomyces sp. V4I23]|uniref:hypothetical protein n=1 Tax=Streptomyces sp. V4I23 TaxID=3042282 RepID=UPI00277FA569|nr:hypothetical protein [Streptomyces sp. V4I23]MDQ1013177.1 hypothetical protein [Streptomyces sp. V4I23]
MGDQFLGRELAQPDRGAQTLVRVEDADVAQHVPGPVQAALVPVVAADVPSTELKHVVSGDLVELLAGVEHDLGQGGEDFCDLASGHAPCSGGFLCTGEGLDGQLRAHVGEQADRAVADQEVVAGQHQATQQEAGQAAGDLVAEVLRCASFCRGGAGDPAQRPRVGFAGVPSFLPPVAGPLRQPVQHTFGGAQSRAYLNSGKVGPRSQLGQLLQHLAAGQGVDRPDATAGRTRLLGSDEGGKACHLRGLGGRAGRVGHRGTSPKSTAKSAAS